MLFNVITEQSDFIVSKICMAQSVPPNQHGGRCYASLCSGDPLRGLGRGGGGNMEVG